MSSVNPLCVLLLLIVILVIIYGIISLESVNETVKKSKHFYLDVCLLQNAFL